eukprot:6205146-Pleurochrysis_carterae.AAC.2
MSTVIGFVLLLAGANAFMFAPKTVFPGPSYSCSRHPQTEALDALSWLNPGYWKMEFVKAQHITNNVPAGSEVLELGSDAKNIYYLKSPSAVTLISETPLQEPPIREAAAKLSIPLSILQGELSSLQLRASGYDAALCMQQLERVPAARQAVVCSLLARTLKPGGRLIFIGGLLPFSRMACSFSCIAIIRQKKASIDAPALFEEAQLEVLHEVENNYAIGIALKPGDAPKESRMLGTSSRAVRRQAAKGKKNKRK